MDTTHSAVVHGDFTAGSKTVHDLSGPQVERAFGEALKQAAGSHRASSNLRGAAVYALSSGPSASRRATDRRSAPTVPDPLMAAAPAGAGLLPAEQLAPAQRAIAMGGPEARSSGLHRPAVEDAGSASSAASPAAAQVPTPSPHEVTSRSPAFTTDQPQTGGAHTASSVTVQLPDGTSAVSAFDVNVLPDGSVDMVISVDHQALRAASDQLDRLKRRLEAKGVSLADIQLNATDPMSSEDWRR